MAKLSKSKLKNHELALRILEKSSLSRDERWTVLEWFQPSADKVGKAFYQTSHENAQSLAWDGGTGKVVDLGAGIGMLSHHIYYDNQDAGNSIDIVCIERDPDLVEVGIKLLPEAEWICGDMFDFELMQHVGPFDFAYSNPPFGLKVKSDLVVSTLSQFAAIEVAMKMAPYANFILPQGVFNLKHGHRSIERNEATDVSKNFRKDFPYAWNISNFPMQHDFQDTGIKTVMVTIQSDEGIERIEDHDDIIFCV
jgi:predicted RNA methylase